MNNEYLDEEIDPIDDEFGDYMRHHNTAHADSIGTALKGGYDLPSRPNGGMGDQFEYPQELEDDDLYQVEGDVQEIEDQYTTAQLQQPGDYSSEYADQYDATGELESYGQDYRHGQAAPTGTDTTIHYYSVEIETSLSIRHPAQFSKVTTISTFKDTLRPGTWKCPQAPVSSPSRPPVAPSDLVRIDGISTGPQHPRRICLTKFG